MHPPRSDASTPGRTAPSGASPTPATAALGAPRPLRFVTPPGWPDPSPDWAVTMQGWEPPAGWVPAPGLPVAPARHAFWRPDPDRFPVEEQPFRAQGGNRVVFGAASLAVALVLVVGTATGRMQLPGWVDGVVVPAIVALGVLSVVVGLVERRRAARAAAAAVAQSAAERRVGRRAVSYLGGAPVFGAVGNEACGPGAASVSRAVRRRSRTARRGVGRSWATVALAAGVAAAAFVAPAVSLFPEGVGGPVVAVHDDQATRAGSVSAHAATDTERPVRISAPRAGRSGNVCITACWAWTLRAVVACPAASAHVEFGTGFTSGRARVERTVDRRLGALEAGSVTEFVEDRTADQEARITRLRCDGAPGPVVGTTVQDGDDDTMWSWTVTPRASCQQATITVVQDEPSADGVSRIVRVEPLTAGVPLSFSLPRPPGAVTAEVQPVTC